MPSPDPNAGNLRLRPLGPFSRRPELRLRESFAVLLRVPASCRAKTTQRAAQDSVVLRRCERRSRNAIAIAATVAPATQSDMDCRSPQPAS